MTKDKKYSVKSCLGTYEDQYLTIAKVARIIMRTRPATTPFLCQTKVSRAFEELSSTVASTALLIEGTITLQDTPATST